MSGCGFGGRMVLAIGCLGLVFAAWAATIIGLFTLADSLNRSGNGLGQVAFVLAVIDLALFLITALGLVWSFLRKALYKWADPIDR